MSRAFSSLAGALWLCGCAAFRDGPSVPLSPWPPVHDAAKPTVSLLVRAGAEQEGQVGDVFELTGGTLGLFPSVIHQHFTVRTVFKDDRGTTLLTMAHAEENDLLIQLFLLPVSLITPPREVVGEIVYDLNRATLIEAARARSLWADGEQQ